MKVLLRKARTLANLISVNARFVKPVSHGFSAILDRLFLAPRLRRGYAPRPRIKKIFVRIKRGKTAPVFYHERTAAFMGTLNEVFGEQHYAPSVELPERPVIFDCGGNVGLASAYFAGRYPRATIHVFEPGGRNFKCLQKMAEAWTREQVKLVLNKAGVWSNSAPGILHRHSFGSASDSFLHSEHSVGTTESVEMLRLDKYLEEKRINRIDLLKLDVEGSEFEAVKGLGSRLKDVHVIVGEMHFPQISESEFVEHLKANGFRVAIKSRVGEKLAIFEAINQEFRPFKIFG